MQPITHLTKNTHPDAQWFPKAGLGIFFHWGISTVHGYTDISWAMKWKCPYSPINVSPDEYFSFAKKFNPCRYNPNNWIKAAKEAGFRYAVLTTRHHDGYALWPSDFGDFNTRLYMDGRDLVGEFIQACRDNGLKVGLYYSPGEWWSSRHYDDFRWKENQVDGWQVDAPVAPQVMKDYKLALAKGQLWELFTRYGKIDMIWFDGNGYEVMSEEEIRELQPGIVIGRGNGTDFASMECEMPNDAIYEQNLKGNWWELCHEANQCWAYTRYDEWNIKPVETLMGWFELARKYNGNFLLNFGPDSEGELTEQEYTRIKEIGEYIKAHPHLLPEWEE